MVMECPRCFGKTVVIKSYMEGEERVRVRECKVCGYVFRTREMGAVGRVVRTEDLGVYVKRYRRRGEGGLVKTIEVVR